MSSVLRVKGDLTQAVKKARKANAKRAKAVGIDPSFRHGTVKAAVTVSASDRTLGRKAWRLASAATENPGYETGQASQNHPTAEWVANPMPLAYVTATKCDSLGRESIVPKHNAETVEFEWRIDHLNRGKRKN